MESYFKVVSKKTGKTLESLKESFEIAKHLILESGIQETSEDFLGNVLYTFRRMERLTENTSTAAVPNIATAACEPDAVIMRKNVYDVDDGLFFKLFNNKRESGKWHSKFFEDPRISEYARQNPKSSFYIRHVDYGMLREIKHF